MHRALLFTVVSRGSTSQKARAGSTVAWRTAGNHGSQVRAAGAAGIRVFGPDGARFSGRCGAIPRAGGVSGSAYDEALSHQDDWRRRRHPRVPSRFEPRGLTQLLWSALRQYCRWFMHRRNWRYHRR